MRPLLLVVGLLAPLAGRADPVSLVHSGYLLAGDDTAVTQLAQPLSFRIWSDAEGGTQVWPTSGAITCSADVASGYYAVTLGSASCGPSLSSDDLPPGAPRWLEVTVGTTLLQPRHLLATPAAALVAARALNADRLGNKTLSEITTDLDARYALASGGTITLTTTGATALTVPTSGALVTAAGAATLTQKTFDQDLAFATNGTRDVGSTSSRARDLWLARDATIAGTVKAGSAAQVTLDSTGVTVAGAGTKVVAPEVSAAQFTSTATSGAPLTVASTTVVPNLNAQLWNGAKLSLPLACQSGYAMTGLSLDGTGTLKADCALLSTGGTRGASTNPGTACWDIRNAFGVQPIADAAYWIDPDGAGGVAPHEVFCDMNTDGGGWTLVDNDATPAATIASRTVGANKDINVTKGSFLPAYSWSGTPQLMVRASLFNGTANWVSFNALNAIAREYPTTNTQGTGTSGRSGDWSIAKLNGNTNQGTQSWIMVVAGSHIATVWIGSGSSSTASCNYTSSNSGLGTYGPANTSTCSTWVR